MTAGERWARDELLALRAAVLRPVAWRRFLAASFARAADTRAARPGLARQARAWSLAALLAGHAARRAACRRGLPAPSAPGWTAWSLAAAAMLDWHLGMLEGPGGELRERLGAADALSLFRTGLAPFVAAGGPPFSALLLIAGATDLLDGRLAARRGPTRLGRDIDTLADVAIKLAAARGARRAGWLSPLTIRLLAGCQIAGFAGTTATYLCTGLAPRTSRRQLRLTAPPLFVGLALAPSDSRLANALVAGSSALTLATAVASTAAPR